jgi:hypothetical protein
VRRLQVCDALRLVPTGPGTTDHLDDDVAAPGAISLNQGLYEVRRLCSARCAPHRFTQFMLACGPLHARNVQQLALSSSWFGGQAWDQGRCRRDRSMSSTAAAPPASPARPPSPGAFFLSAAVQVGRAPPADIVIAIPTVRQAEHICLHAALAAVALPRPPCLRRPAAFLPAHRWPPARSSRRPSLSVSRGSAPPRLQPPTHPPARPRLPLCSPRSTRHATLRVGADSIVLTDLGSTNGTYLDGQELEPTQAVRAAAAGARMPLGFPAAPPHATRCLTACTRACSPTLARRLLTRSHASLAFHAQVEVGVGQEVVFGDKYLAKVGAAR